MSGASSIVGGAQNTFKKTFILKKVAHTTVWLLQLFVGSLVMQVTETEYTVVMCCSFVKYFSKPLF